MHYAIANLRRMELEQGFTLIDSALWLNLDDWREIVVSQDKTRVRLVLLDARDPGHGAFTRLIAGIWSTGLTPVICEPNQFLTDWCHRHHFRPRRLGKGDHRQEIWYPRRAR